MNQQVKKTKTKFMAIQDFGLAPRLVQKMIFEFSPSLFLFAFAMVFPGCFEEKSSSDDSKSGATVKPVVSQRSTGAFSPFATKEETSAKMIYDPEDQLILNVWKSRATILKGTFDHPAQVSFAMTTGGASAQTQNLQVVSPMVELKITDLAGLAVDRSKMGRYIKIETIVDRFIDAKSTVALIYLNYGTAQETRWMVLPEEMTLVDQSDGSKLVSFQMKDVDFSFVIAAARDGNPTNGFLPFKSVPREAKDLTFDRSKVTDEATQVQLSWSAFDGSRTGYYLETAYQPITTLACKNGKPVDQAQITKVRQNFPKIAKDSMTLNDLKEDATLYIQLCSSNSRSPPDISSGVDLIYDLPKRSKVELENLPEEASRQPNLAVEVAGDSLTHYRYALLKNAESCTDAAYSDWILVSTKIEDAVTESAYLLCVLGKKSDLNIQKIPTEYGFTVDFTPVATFAIDQE